MEVFTRKLLARSSYRRWRESHPLGGKFIKDDEIAVRLAELGTDPEPDRVDQVMGHKGWTKPPYCDECGSSSEVSVRIGEEPDWESRTAYLCEGCLRKALAMIEDVKKES